MATLSNPIFYESGTAGASAVIGFESNQNRVVRYNLDLDSGEQASHIHVLFDEANGSISIGGGADQFSKINDKMSFYFAISTDPDAFVNAGYADISNATGKAVFTPYRDNAHYKVICDADVLLYPNTQYYLWVFPGFSSVAGGNNTWGWLWWGSSLTITVELSGYAGVVWVETSAESKPTNPYVWHSEEWHQILPYVQKSDAWSIGTGQ